MAWISASESGQIELMMKTAYNLGTDYSWNGQYESGLDYLDKAIELAKAANNSHVEGSAQKGMGNAYALMGKWETAVSHYLISYNLFHGIQHLNFLTSLCLDLVEAYAELDEYEQARAYLAEAQQLSREIGHERYETVLKKWHTRYPQMFIELSERQQKIITFAKANDGIKRSQLMTLAKISKSQAYRELEALCEANILEQVGQGRATKYILKTASEG
jgi:tetratricopeptide (TPR) repeat protein